MREGIVYFYNTRITDKGVFFFVQATGKQHWACSNSAASPLRLEGVAFLEEEIISHMRM
jgi:hypothetical protein